MRNKSDQLRAFSYFALGFVVCMIAMAASATGDHHSTPPKIVVVEKHDHAAVGALIGAGITYWLVQRHKRRQERPLVIIPAQRSEECSATVERVIAACGITK